MGAAAKHVPISNASTLHPAASAFVTASQARARAALAEEQFARAWQEGQAMTLEPAATYVLQDAES